MNKKILDSIFVIVLFGLTFAVITQNVSVTGNSVALPTADMFVKQQEVLVPGLSGNPGAQKIFFTLDEKVNLAVRSFSEGSIAYAKKGENTYGITALHIIQDFEHNDEYVILLITPGDKRLLLKEGAIALVDFNNDGKDDLEIELLSINHSQASLIIKTP